jgi:hypothetical protein
MLVEALCWIAGAGILGGVCNLEVGEKTLTPYNPTRTSKNACICEVGG